MSSSDVVPTIEVPAWKHLKWTTAWLCCDCSFFLEWPECCGCQQVGTCCCQTQGCKCAMDYNDCDYCCQNEGNSFCISLKGCEKYGCMKAIYCQGLAGCTCCFIFHQKQFCLCHM